MTRYIRIRGVSNPQSLPCVYVLRQMDHWSRRSAVPLKVCDSAMDALILAIAVRDVFTCPVWVAQLGTPADVRTFAAQRVAVGSNTVTVLTTTDAAGAQQ